MQLRSIFSLALPVLLAACGDPQVGSDYHGESLLTIKGTIVNELGEAPAGPVDAVLVWNNMTSEADTESFPVRTTVTGSFPAAFTLSVHEPPPAESLNDLTEIGLVDTRVGIATIEAVGADSAGEDRQLGVDEHHVIVYVESEMDDDGAWSNIFGGPLAPGFHVMDVASSGSEWKAEQQAAFDACNAAATTEAEHMACEGHNVKIKMRPSADGPSTMLTVRMGENLKDPDWH